MKWVRLFHLTVLLAGLLWLGCDIPVSPMPDVGDEVRLTNDPGPNRDPFWFTYGDPETLEDSQICFHDGQTIFLYDWDSGGISEIYTAPVGYEITTLDESGLWTTVYPVYAFALYGDGQSVIVVVFEDGEVEILRDQGPPIESMVVNYDHREEPSWDGDKHYCILLSRDHNLSVIYTNGLGDNTGYGVSLGEGYDLNQNRRTFFVRGEG